MGRGPDGDDGRLLRQASKYLHVDVPVPKMLSLCRTYNSRKNDLYCISASRSFFAGTQVPESTDSFVVPWID